LLNVILRNEFMNYDGQITRMCLSQ